MHDMSPSMVPALIGRRNCGFGALGLIGWQCARWSLLKAEDVFDMHSEMLRITADAIGLLAFAYDFGGISSMGSYPAPFTQS
jgi:hypothetical protein